MDDQPQDIGGTDAEILDCVGQLMAQILGVAERIAARLGVPAFFLKALHLMDCPMAMKELGRRMHCDLSFVTSIADMLEQRGLAARQPHPGDRRIKELVLTATGSLLRQQVESELAAAMPWASSLTQAEREQFLRLLRKMSAGLPSVTPAAAAPPPVPAGAAAPPPVPAGATNPPLVPAGAAAGPQADPGASGTAQIPGGGG